MSEEASSYATQDVATLAGISSTRIRHLVRRGLLRPRRNQQGQLRFSFQDMLVLKTAQHLLSGRLSPRRVFRLLSSLQRLWAGEHGLSALRVQLDGSRVMVKQHQSLWDAETGQGVLDFGGALAPAASAPVVTLQPGQARAGAEVADRFQDLPDLDDLDSDDWYNLGLDLEELDLAQAMDAYRQAIRLDPENVDAYVNLGRLKQLRGHMKSARHYYLLALQKMPDHQLALYNLGTLLDELELLDDAMAYYRQAHLIPDAHYNLARIYEMLGDEFSAFRHFRRYEQMLSS